MPFTAHDLRYSAEQSYPQLYGYLHRHAQRYLGALKYDAFEVDVVVGHVVEQLVRLGLLGAADTTPLGGLDRLSDAQFYAFLNRSVRNKAIDRLRKRRLPVNTTAELEGDTDIDDKSLNEAVTSIWGTTPFKTPEEIALALVTQNDLRNVLKHCIMALGSAPHQLQAVIQELRELGGDDLIALMDDALPSTVDVSESIKDVHASQHKDHAHKKLRHCLQERSTHLVVVVALRLTKYATRAATTNDYTVDVLTLAQRDIPEGNVRLSLKQLVREKVLDWQGEDVVHLTTAQMKLLTRFYKEE